MKMMSLGNMLVGLLVAVACIAAGADSATDEKTVAERDNEYQAAVKVNDANTMDRILADDFVVVLGTGQIYTKSDLLDMACTKQRRSQ